MNLENELVNMLYFQLAPNVEEVLRAIANAERGPAEEELSAAPYINHYRLEKFGKSVQQIHGKVQGYPTIDDPFVTTTPHLGLDPDEREEMVVVIQVLLRAQRNWVAVKIQDDQKLAKIVKERSHEVLKRKSIDELRCPRTLEIRKLVDLPWQD